MSDCQTCGTGSGSNNPKPGDPDNNISLSARTVYGGINVSWSWPTVNEFAVALTVVYRGLNNNPDAMIEVSRVGGSIYFDSLNPEQDTTYYYWIQLISVNGTKLPKIGPVSATAKKRGTQTMEDLTGLIDSSVLAQTLKEDIAGINQIGADLITEIEDRIAANTELSGLLADVQSGVTQAMTYLSTEITERKTSDSAIVSSLTTMAASVQNNAALIFQEATVRANADSALAQQTTQLFTQTGENRAAIQQEITARTNADSAISTSVSTLTSRVGNAETTITQNNSASVTRDQALAQSVTGVESSLNGNIATVKSQLQTSINTTNGIVNEIGALYTTQVQVNGLVGGFGIYNTGQRVDAGFDVDLFWVGRTQANKVKPFIISNDTVYIDKARIRDADIDTLKIAGNSVMTGSHTSGSLDTIPSNGTKNLLSRTLNLGDSFNSGLIVSATVRMTALNNETVGFRILVNGVEAGDQRVSAREGYGILVPVSGFNVPNSGTATVVLQGYSPAGGQFDIVGTTMSIMGGKR